MNSTGTFRRSIWIQRASSFGWSVWLHYTSTLWRPIWSFSTGTVRWSVWNNSGNCSSIWCPTIVPNESSSSSISRTSICICTARSSPYSRSRVQPSIEILINCTGCTKCSKLSLCLHCYTIRCIDRRTTICHCLTEYLANNYSLKQPNRIHVTFGHRHTKTTPYSTQGME